MKNKIASALRRIADRISPNPLWIRPAENLIKFEGKKYQLAELRAERTFNVHHPDNIKNLKGYYKDALLIDLLETASLAVEYNESDTRLEAKLKVLMYEGS